MKDDSDLEKATRMLDSFMPWVHGLAVCINGLSGKNKKLRKLIEKHGGEYIVTSPQTHPKMYSEDESGVFFSSFAEARNASFDLADSMKGYDWYLWADTDDILVAGDELQAVADQALESKNDQILFPYWYSIKLNSDNTFDHNCVQIEHMRERLIRPGVCKWVSRLHEIAVPKDDKYKMEVAVYAYLPKDGQECVWAHITERSIADENMNRNIRILELQAKEEEFKDPRTLLYMAKLYYDRNDEGDMDKALVIVERDYMAMSGWPEERGNALEMVANIYARKNDHRKAVEVFHKAIQEWPQHHSPYLGLAREYSELGMHDQSNFWLEVAVNMPAPTARTTIGNPWEIKITAASLKYNDCMRRNKIEEALYWLGIRNRLLGITDDPMVEALEESIETEKSAKNVLAYAQWLKKTGHTENISHLLKSLPYELGSEPFAHYIANDVQEPKVWDKKTIVYYASWGTTHFEKWSPLNLDQGIGGSERAVIELAREWVKKGYDVTVFGDPREDAGDYDGVHYRPWYEINWKDTFDTLILWRSPHLLDRDIKANRVFYDAHDVESQLNWPKERIEKIDGVFFKSQFHRRMIPKLPDEKAITIPNGITL